MDIFSKYAWVVPLKVKKVLQLLMIFKKLYVSLMANQTNYRWLKAVNFTIDQ